MLILRKFRKQLEELVNNSGLPIDAIYYVLKDVVIEVEGIYNGMAENEDAEADQRRIGRD